MSGTDPPFWFKHCNNVRLAHYTECTDYRLDESHAGEKDFPSGYYIQPSSEAYPTSYPMGNGGPYPGGSVGPGYDTDHLFHLVPRSRTSKSYTFSTSHKHLDGIYWGLKSHYGTKSTNYGAPLYLSFTSPPLSYAFLFSVLFSHTPCTFFH
jgi:hypothetical protein